MFSLGLLGFTLITYIGLFELMRGLCGEYKTKYWIYFRIPCYLFLDIFFINLCL